MVVNKNILGAVLFRVFSPLRPTLYHLEAIRKDETQATHPSEGVMGGLDEAKSRNEDHIYGYRRGFRWPEKWQELRERLQRRVTKRWTIRCNN